LSHRVTGKHLYPLFTRSCIQTEPDARERLHTSQQS
jgi:hypothetical protein